MGNPRTIVTSVRGLRPSAAGPDLIYVGRACYGWPESDWHNPFAIIKGHLRVSSSGRSWWLDNVTRVMADAATTPVTAVTIYREWLMSRPDLIQRLGELRGKRLACWCGEWAPGRRDIGCHAVVLARLADGDMHQLGTGEFRHLSLPGFD